MGKIYGYVLIALRTQIDVKHFEGHRLHGHQYHLFGYIPRRYFQRHLKHIKYKEKK